MMSDYFKPSGSDVEARKGKEPITSGLSYIDIIFDAPFLDALWIGGGIAISNIVDASPVNLYLGVISARTADGFRQHLSVAPGTGNYRFEYRCFAFTPVAETPSGTPLRDENNEILRDEMNQILTD